MTSPDISYDPNGCTYVRREDGINVFIFTHATPQAIDAWVRHLDVLYTNAPLDVPVLNLIDVSRCGQVPLAYAFRRGQEWIRRHGKRPPARTAFVQESHSSMITLVDSFLQLLRMDGHVFHFFELKDYDAALAWLREG